MFLIKNALGQVKKYKAMNKLQVPHFTLTNKLTQEQLDFFDKNGLIIFRKFISREMVDLFIKETQRLEKEWLDAGLEKVRGFEYCE